MVLSATLFLSTPGQVSPIGLAGLLETKDDNAVIRRTTDDYGQDALRLTVGTWIALLGLVSVAIGSIIGSTVAVVSKATRIETKLNEMLTEKLPARTLTLELAVQQIVERQKEHEEALRQRRAAPLSGGS